MAQPIQSRRLLDHLQTYAGDHRGTETKPGNKPDRAYSLERFDQPSANVTTIASNGLRFLDTDEPFGVEIACTLHTSQAGYTRAIMGAMGEFITQTRTGIEFGQIIDNHDDLFDCTHKQGLLAATHPTFTTTFDYLTQNPHTTLTSDNVELQIITLIPITRTEIELAAHNTDELYEHWNKTRPDLLDITRLADSDWPPGGVPCG